MSKDKYIISDDFKQQPLVVEHIPDEKEGFAKLKEVAVNHEIKGYEPTQRDLEYLYNKYENYHFTKGLIIKKE